MVDCEFAPGRHPAILLEWRRESRGWSGRVVIALDHNSGPVVLEAWVPAGRLRPLG